MTDQYDWSQIETPLKPFDHQYDMIRHVLSRDSGAIYAEMGTGKTKAMIDAYRLRSQREDLVMLVLCPKSVIHSWTSDLKANDVTNFVVVDANLTKKRKHEAFRNMARSGKGVIIMNYEQILTMIDVPYDLIDWVVLDEGHNIKNPKAKRTKSIIAHFIDTKYKNIMTGTPIANHPTDVWSQAWFLDPKIFNRINFYAFRNRYCVMGGFQNKQVVSHKNLPELKSRIDNFSIQLKKEDCLDLPEKMYIPRVLEMPKEMKTQYDSMMHDLILELSEEEHLTAEVAATKIMRLSQITSGAFLEGKNPKLEELSSIIDELIENKRQVVIMYVFTKSGDMIEKMIQEKGLAYSKIDGSTNDRPDQIDRFQKKKAKVFMGQVASCGLGVTLTAASTLIYFENDYNLTHRKQSEDRIHRIGQKENCTYIDLCYGGTVDEKVHTAIRKKQDVATYLVDSFKKGGASFKGTKKKTSETSSDFPERYSSDVGA